MRVIGSDWYCAILANDGDKGTCGRSSIINKRRYRGFKPSTSLHSDHQASVEGISEQHRQNSNIDEQHIVIMNANETQTRSGIASPKDEIIIFSLASILSLSLMLHAYYLGTYIWRKRLIYVEGKNRLRQDRIPPRGDEEQGV